MLTSFRNNIYVLRSLGYKALVPLLLVMLALGSVVLAASAVPQATDVDVQGVSLSSAISVVRAPNVTETVYLPFVSNSYPLTYPYRLTSGLSNDFQPRFSPDGNFIVFTSDRAGQKDVFSMSVAGGTPVNLTQSLAREEDTPVFSPDGKTIAYASNDTASGDWDIFLMNPDGSNKRVAISHTGSDEIQPWFSLDGQSLYFASNLYADWNILHATIGSSYLDWTWRTYATGADRLPVLSSDGTTVVFRSERDGNSEIYLMSADGNNQRNFTTDPAYDSYGGYTSDMSGIVFDSDRSGATRSYLVNPGGTGMITLETRSDWQMAQSSVSNDGMWRAYTSKLDNGDTDLYVDRFTSPLMAIGRKGADNIQANCDWEGSVLAYGWIQVWQATHQDQYLQWLKEYVNRCIPNKTISHVNDAAFGYAALIVYQSDPQPSYLTFAQNLADWLMTTAVRTPDGTLSHMNDGDVIWVDTLLSVPPFLVEMSKVTSNTLYFNEAVSQVLKHANWLQNPGNGLYHHAWSTSQSKYTGPAWWSRGNGWALLGDIAVLSVMTDAHPSRSALLNIMNKQVAALKPWQNSSGLWPTVISHSDYYLETSGSALIGYGIRQGVKKGWLDYSLYNAVGQAAVVGVWNKVLTDGTVTDVSVPTAPMPNDSDYNSLPHSQLQLYGQGVALMLAAP